MRNKRIKLKLNDIYAPNGNKELEHNKNRKYNTLLNEYTGYIGIFLKKALYSNKF